MALNSVPLAVFVLVVAAAEGFSRQSGDFKQGGEEGRSLHHLTETGSVRAIPDTERQALVDLYTATDGDNWKRNDKWLSLEDPCTWYGVICSSNHTGILEPEFLDTTRIRDPMAGHVLEINLSDNNLVGFIPASINAFTFLRHLYMHTNAISGSLPVTLSDLEWLSHCRLWNNLITGPLPTDIGRLTRLQYFNIARNQLTGPIPASIAQLQSLSVLYLSQNFLEDPIPPELMDREAMPRLKTLYLHKNQFEADVLPACKERYCGP